MVTLSNLEKVSISGLDLAEWLERQTA